MRHSAAAGASGMENAGRVRPNRIIYLEHAARPSMAGHSMTRVRKNSRSSRFRIIGQNHDRFDMLGRCLDIRESAVRRHHLRADAVR